MESLTKQHAETKETLTGLMADLDKQREVDKLLCITAQEHIAKLKHAAFSGQASNERDRITGVDIARLLREIGSSLRRMTIDELVSYCSGETAFTGIGWRFRRLLDHEFTLAATK